MQSSKGVRNKSDETTIMITIADKLRLDKLKVHRREPYRDVITRLLDQSDKTSGSKGPSYIRGLIDSVVPRPTRESEQ